MEQIQITNYYSTKVVIFESLFTLICIKRWNWKFVLIDVLIDAKSFSDMPVKNEEEAFEKNIDMSNNNEYTTGNLLDFVYFKNYKVNKLN